MGKQGKENVRPRRGLTDDRPFIPQKYQHSAAILLLYLSLVIFFHAVIFDGKTYQSADTIASHSWETLLKDAQADGIYPLWNPYIFCGMPGYASLTFSPELKLNLTILTSISDIWWVVRKCAGCLFLEQKVGVWLLFYLVYGIGVYLFVFYKLKNKPIALITALMATYATYVAILIMIGHVTKIAVLAWFPYVFLLVEKLREKFNLLQALLLAIFIHLMIGSGHVQFIFYIYLALGTYLLFLFIRAFIKKENWKGILFSGTSLICATIIAFLMGADQYLSTLEYKSYSIRGSNPITNTSSTSQTKTIEGGLDYDYATSWSFSPGEMITFFIPSWYGFGPHPYKGPLTQNREIKLNTYVGPQPFVDGPQYMGIVVIVLALIGFYRNRKEPFVQYMGAIIVLSLLVSFGKEFSLPIIPYPFNSIYNLMYSYFPMFNKFRIPLMILVLVQFFTPILAGYGILSLISEQNKKISPLQDKRWKYIFGGLAAGILAALVGKGVLKEIYGMFFPLQEVGRALARSYGQLNPEVLGMIYDFVFSAVVTDILWGCVLLLVVFGAFYFYKKGKLRPSILYFFLIITVIIDLWRVAWKPFEPTDRQENIQAIAPPDFVKALQQDTTLFRVLKIQDGQPIYDNSLAYWKIQNAYGYQGAKMRIYQDMVDVAGLGNPLTWQLMNIKYLITNKDESDAGLVQVYNSPDTKVYGVRFWLPRVFFVNRYEVSDNLGILKKIAARSFDPRDIAFISEDIKTKIDPPLQGAEAEMIQYGLQNFTIKATATGNNLLFLSEAYYPKGWKAFIDGNEVEILRLDYLFRGVIVPQGKHTIEMKFEPNSYTTGRNISLASNIILMTGIAFQGVVMYRKRKK